MLAWTVHATLLMIITTDLGLSIRVSMFEYVSGDWYLSLVTGTSLVPTLFPRSIELEPSQPKFFSQNPVLFFPKIRVSRLHPTFFPRIEMSRFQQNSLSENQSEPAPSNFFTQKSDLAFPTLFSPPQIGLSWFNQNELGGLKKTN